MKHLRSPAFAVISSTLGCIYACRVAGMPPHDVKVADLLAFNV